MNQNSENNKVWLDELSDDIYEMLADTKQVKFSTHKNRKLFTGKLIGMVKEAIHQNTIAKRQDSVRFTENSITRPNTKKSEGHSVMTPDLSARGDQILEQNVANKRSGLRSW